MTIEAVVRAVAVTLSLCALPAAAVAADDPALVSVNLSGGVATAWGPRVSPDGRYVLFISAGGDLVPGATAGVGRVYLRDMLLGVTECCSVNNSGELANGACDGAFMSADARYVSFVSSASNMPPSSFHVYTRDRLTQTTTGGPIPGECQLNEDGTEGLYMRLGSIFQVEVQSLGTGAIEPISVDPLGQPGNANSYSFSLQPFSADGRYVVFSSVATNLVPGVPAGVQQIYVRDRVAATTTLVSATAAGVPGSEHSAHPSISADGRFVAFSSMAENLGGLPHGSAVQVYVRDLQTGALELVSVTNAGVPNQAGANWVEDVQETSISADGRFVAFELMTNNLAPPLASPVRHAIVRDRLADLTLSASVDQAGAPRTGYDPMLSRDGRFVSLWTPDPLATPDVFDSGPDAYRYDRRPWTEVEVGLAGGAGEPRLVVQGAPQAGAPIVLGITHTLPSALVQLVIGFAQVNLPFKGGVLVPAPALLLPLPTNAQGMFLIKTSWPAGVPAGTPLVLQGWMPDPAGPAGFAATNGVSNFAQ